jgi:hypothetical protein
MVVAAKSTSGHGTNRGARGRREKAIIGGVEVPLDDVAVFTRFARIPEDAFVVLDFILDFVFYPFDWTLLTASTTVSSASSPAPSS